MTTREYYFGLKMLSLAFQKCCEMLSFHRQMLTELSTHCLAKGFLEFQTHEVFSLAVSTLPSAPAHPYTFARCPYFSGVWSGSWSCQALTRPHRM